MSGRVHIAAACVLVAAVLLGPFAGAAVADPPWGTPTPTPSPAPTTSPGQLTPVGPPPAVTAIHFSAAEATDRVTVSWTGSAGARNYTVQVQGPGTPERRTFDTAVTSLDLTRMPPGSTIRVGIVAHGLGGDSVSADASWTRPAAVPPVASAALAPTAAGLRVTWVPSPDAPPGSRYVVRVRCADGTVLARTVSGSAVGFAGVRRNTLYSASLTTEAPDGRHSVPFEVSAVLVPAASVVRQAGAPAVPPAPGSAPEATGGGTAPVVPAVEPLATPTPAAAPATLVSSPAMALACAVAALLLGGSAIAVLLRRRPPAR